MPLTQELVLTILDFLLSPNGKFIREPLITEAVETVDALGLTAASLGFNIDERPVPSAKGKA